jgi:hypothetical protein
MIVDRELLRRPWVLADMLLPVLPLVITLSKLSPELVRFFFAAAEELLRLTLGIKVPVLSPLPSAPLCTG